MSRSTKAGLTFPVGRVARFLRTGKFASRLGAGAPVYLAAVLEYLTAEVGATDKSASSPFPPRILRCSLLLACTEGARAGWERRARQQEDPVRLPPIFAALAAHCSLASSRSLAERLSLSTASINPRHIQLAIRNDEEVRIAALRASQCSTF